MEHTPGEECVVLVVAIVSLAQQADLGPGEVWGLSV